MKLRVWWVPQFVARIPMFYVAINSLAEGVQILNVLADYDQFQLDNKIKPDYCNEGGIEMFDPDYDEDSPEGSWVNWCDEETGEDDPVEFLKTQAETDSKIVASLWKRFADERPEMPPGTRRSIMVKTLSYVGFANVIGKEIHMVYFDRDVELYQKIFNFGDRIEEWMWIPE